MQNLGNVTLNISFFFKIKSSKKEATTNDLFVCILKLLCLGSDLPLLVFKKPLV